MITKIVTFTDGILFIENIVYVKYEESTKRTFLYFLGDIQNPLILIEELAQEVWKLFQRECQISTPAEQETKGGEKL